MAGYRLGLSAELCLFLLCGYVRAADERATLVMIGFLDALDESNDTYASVRAGISDLNAEVGVEWRATCPAVADALTLARAVATAHSALAVFWRQQQQLFLFVPKRDGNTLLSRPIGHAGEEGAADTIGLIVRSALASLLSARPNAATGAPTASVPPPDQLPDANEKGEEALFSAVPAIPLPSTPGEAPGDAEIEGKKEDAAVALEDKSPPSGADPATTPDRAPDGKPTTGADRAAEVSSTAAPKAAGTAADEGRRLLMALLYGLDTVAKGHPVINGARFTLGVRLIHRLYLTTDYTLCGPPIEAISLDAESAGTLKLTRHPFSVGARLIIFEKGRWRLGGGLLAEWDFMKETINVVASNSGIAAKRAGGVKTQVGIVPFAMAGLHLIGPLYAGLHLGMRALPKKTKYYEEIRTGEKQLVYSPWRLQLRFSVGLEALFF